MSREIKFRIYDKRDKQILFEGFHVFGEVTMFNLIEQYAFETKGEISSLERYDDFEINEWSGMQDKNKTDIYEGDLLSIKTANGTTITVECAYGIITRTMDTGWECEIPCFHFKRPDGLNSLPIAKNWAGKRDVEMLEVIGNIYSNPELTK